MDREPSPAVAGSVEGRTLASLMVGVTRNIALEGDAAAGVRKALDLAFDRLDVRCPLTPKTLLSGLAPGAELVAAEAALARPGWSVIAVVATSESLRLEAVEGKARDELLAVKADPRVKTVVLDPLRRMGADPSAGAGEPARTAGADAFHADHDEQVGLFISERSAILIGVLKASALSSEIDSAARIVRHRLTGELDADARRVVNRSLVLEEPPRLVDRHTGPVWIVDLETFAETPGEPAKALRVSTPGGVEPAALGDNHATLSSLRLADSIEGINQRIGGIDQKDWNDLEDRAGPEAGDAASYLLRLRLALELVQAETVTRVRRSIWQLAVLSCVAILAFEVYVAWSSQPGAKAFGIAYPFVVSAAVFIYWRAAKERWQRFAEDYRAIAEALRVQFVWWASGLTGRGDRIESYYLCGAHGALKQLRILISGLIDSALLRFDKPAPDLAAADLWAAEQIDFFSKRIASRQREIAVVEAMSWFLFVTSLGVATCLAIDLAWQLRGAPNPSTKAPSMDLLGKFMTQTDWASLIRLPAFLAATAVCVSLCLFAVTPRRLKAEDEADAVVAKSNLVVGLAGAATGLILTFGLADLATIVSFAGHDYPDKAAWARELIGIAVILPASIAGAIRFVSDKSSWSAELTGYEHARDHFLRGQRALDSIADPCDADGLEHQEIVRALGEEALGENENWLRSHRERPLEPIVGG